MIESSFNSLSNENISEMNEPYNEIPVCLLVILKLLDLQDQFTTPALKLSVIEYFNIMLQNSKDDLGLIHYEEGEGPKINN